MKKAMVAIATVLGMITLSVPAMAATNLEGLRTQMPTLVAETTAKNEDGITEKDEMMYVTADLLYVREIPSTEGEIIDSLAFGSRVKVTGAVDEKVDEREWYRVEVNGEEGFAAAEFLDENAPAAPAAAVPAAAYRAPAATQTTQTAATAATPKVPVSQNPPAEAPAGNTGSSNGKAPIVKTTYVHEGASGDIVTIQKDANGKWTDEYGNSLTWITDYDAITEDGEMYTSYDPTKQASPCEDEIAPTLEAYWNGTFH